MGKFHISIWITVFAACSLSAQTLTLDNGIARMDISLRGGVITAFRLNTMALNPIHQYGHFICFDRWGPSSPEDQALGIPQHGEASRISWVLDESPVPRAGSYYAEMSCTLPIIKLGLNRKIYLNQTSSVFKVVEEISNLNESPKVFNLVQHPTIGPPFLDETTIVDTRVDSGFSQAGNLPPGPADVFTWPEALVDGDSTDLRYLTPDHTWWQSVVSFILDDAREYGWVTAVNPTLNLMVGYIWPTSEYPWLNLWLMLQSNAPFARGLEFGSTGLHQPWPEVLEMDTIFGKQMYEEVGVDETVIKSYYAFLSEIPSDYKGVESVTIVGDTIIIEEYGLDPARKIELGMAGILSAQEEVMVIEGGPSRGGSLETTINGDTAATGERINPNRIYELKAGETYLQHGPILVENPEGTITIRGRKGGAKPVILKVPLEEVNIGTNEINSSLALQNVQYQGMETDSSLAWTMWNIKGNNHHLLVEDCLVEHCRGAVFDMDEVRTGAGIEIRDCYFRDLNDFGQWWAGRIVECKVPVDTFIFENNTVSGGGLTILGQECLFDYSVINHNTFINNHKYPFLNQHWKEVYFTNNLFVNANMAGEDMENVVSGGADPDAQLRGISGLDSIEINILMQGKYLNEDSTALTEEVDGLDDIIYYAADNVVTYSNTLDNYYNGTVDGVWEDAPASYLTWTGQEGPFKVLNVPGIWSNERTKHWIAEYDNLKDENNSIYEMMVADLGLGTDPLPPDAADVFVQWNRVQWAVPGAALPADFSPYYFGDYNPITIPGVGTEDSYAGGITRISDLLEDFSYSADLVSKSDGLRIGALHWNDEAFDPETSIARVKDAYNGIYTGTGKGVGYSGSELELDNHPNPFNSTTTISFNLPEDTNVNLAVYDISGRLVKALLDEKRAGGQHTLQFRPDNATSGTYFLRLTTGDGVATRKIMLIFR
jgi:hypothetical protein